MKVELKDKICITCPYRVKNSNQLTVSTIKDMVRNGITNACHREQAKADGCTETTGVQIYAKQCQDKDEPFVVCKGYIKAYVDAKHPPANDGLVQLCIAYMHDTFDESDNEPETVNFKDLGII